MAEPFAYLGFSDGAPAEDSLSGDSGESCPPDLRRLGTAGRKGGGPMSGDVITLVSTRIYPGDGEPFPGCIRIGGGKIVGVEKMSQAVRPGNAASCGEIVLDVGDSIVIPGLIDIHVHGSGGFSAADGSATLEGMAKVLARSGVTAFQPALGAAPVDEMERSIEGAYQFASGQGGGAAEMLGIHLEGPFLSRKFPGAMAEQNLLDPDIPLLSRWVELARGNIGRVTLAPELPGATEMVEFLVERGIRASIGHTAATYDEAVRGFRAGISIVTHTFNAMRGFHHREPGALGAALTEKGIFLELIADCLHVHPAAMSLMVASCGVDSVVLASDAMPAAGSPPGEYEFLGRRVTLGLDGKVTLEDGTLAGSSAFLKDCLRNMVERVGVSFEDALRMATVNPAKALGVFDRKGTLASGKDADVVVLSEDYEVLACWTKGVEVKNVFRDGEA